MGFIDCDSHVAETSETWDYLEPNERTFRPRLVTAHDPDEPGLPPPSFFVAGDTWTRCFPPDCNLRGNANVFSPGTVQLSDLAAREQDIDALGIDVQLLISTFWIGVEMDNPVAEAALCRSYNRWVAERVAGRTDRFPWVMRAPLRMVDRMTEELESSRAAGAVGVQLRGIEHGYYLSDPMFWPLYERAQDLDMVMVVHLGNATRRTENIPFGQLIPTPTAALQHVYNIMAGFHAVVTSPITRHFPRLRWAFLEGGATWAPAVIQQHARLEASADRFLHIQHITGEQLAAQNIFIACQADEDLRYLVGSLGDQVLCAGTDYGHNDLGSELGVHHSIASRDDLSPDVARRIVDANGRALLRVADGFRPSDVAHHTLDLPHTHRTDGGPAVVGAPA